MIRTPRTRPVDIPYVGTKVPTPEDVIIVPPQLLKSTASLGRRLAGMENKWALYGETAELVMGVNTSSDHLEVITNGAGADEIASKLSKGENAVKPEMTEKVLARKANVESQFFPIKVRSKYAEYQIEDVRLEVYGNMQYKVGDWEWGDPLDCNPAFIFVVGAKIPTAPLRLASDIAFALGWLDRVQLIEDAIERSKHHI